MAVPYFTDDLPNNTARISIDAGGVINETELSYEEVRALIDFAARARWSTTAATLASDRKSAASLRRCFEKAYACLRRAGYRKGE